MTILIWLVGPVPVDETLGSDHVGQALALDGQSFSRAPALDMCNPVSGQHFLLNLVLVCVCTG